MISLLCRIEFKLDIHRHCQVFPQPQLTWVVVDTALVTHRLVGIGGNPPQVARTYNTLTNKWSQDWCLVQCITASANKLRLWRDLKQVVVGLHHIASWPRVNDLINNLKQKYGITARHYRMVVAQSCWSLKTFWNLSTFLIWCSVLLPRAFKCHWPN